MSAETKPMEKPEKPGVYFATYRQTGLRELLRVVAGEDWDYNPCLIALDEFHTTTMIGDYHDWTLVIDPLARAEVQG